MLDSEAAARRLMDDHDRRRAFGSFAAGAGVTDLAAAYDVQAAYVRLLTARHQSQPAGYKIGLTSARMQAMCGIDHPIAGVVLAQRIRPTGAVLKAGDYGRLGVEFEIAVKLGRDLPVSGDVSIDDVAVAVAGVTAAVEIVDDRGADYGAVDVRSLVADNAWNEGIVMGTFRSSWPDLATVIGSVSLNGQFLDKGSGSDVLGHPFHAVAWLARHLERRGGLLRAGDVIMTGSIVRTQFPAAGAAYDYDIPGLGAVSLRIEQ